MSGPANSSTNAYGAREYVWPPNSDKAERFPSVTTLLGDGVPKRALIYWATGECSKYVLDNYELVGQAMHGSNGWRVADKMIREAPWNSRDSAADLGSALHSYADHRANGMTPKRALLALELGEVDSARLERLASTFELFLDEWKPEFIRSEFTIFNRRYGYAGTGDFIARVKGHGVALGDFKTTKAGRQGHGIYPEACLQMNAYAHGEFIGERNGTESKMPVVDSLLGVNIRPEGYAVVQAELSERAWRAFLYASQIARFVKDGGDWLSSPLAPPIGQLL